MLLLLLEPKYVHKHSYWKKLYVNCSCESVFELEASIKQMKKAFRFPVPFSILKQQKKRVKICLMQITHCK